MAPWLSRGVFYVNQDSYVDGSSSNGGRVVSSLGLTDTELKNFYYLFLIHIHSVFCNVILFPFVGIFLNNCILSYGSPAGVFGVFLVLRIIMSVDTKVLILLWS